ncbi:phosphate ABC transporter substrate-binding protein PstS [Aquihabitans sp. G128]|uniref:phosphate ABC transporter substrate-binding protein PstS n=1 Tax=Aquihabitans sp. G128 TaxID=2849779 RepID=UPI001C217ED7|nr:phosphate ABC transporter substrate-binding protein PstS [Aquihabitans sp. G128]QXC60443.1 phosphate ABC transporter substrate-binding protein PstS [Aquihabitans sp. G128]
MVAVLSLLAAACGSSDSDGASSTTTKAAASDGDSTTTTKAADTDGLDKLSGKLDGAGSSFQDTFEQQVSADFGTLVKDAGGSATITYTKSGSSDGKKGLADKTIDFAGSDSPLKDEEKPGFGDRKVLYFPIVGGPITVAYNLDGVDELNLSPATIAGIFQATITTWDDDAIKADNPDADLPSTKITVVHRSDGSGTTSNFTKFLVAAAPDDWKLESGETVNWPASTQGAEKSTGVTTAIGDTDGAIGYADLADAAKENLSVAAIGNKSGDFIAPTPDSASAALAASDVADDLTYSPLNVDADGAYPITSPTWIIVDAVQADQGKADIIKAYLKYVLTTGQDQAKALLYAPLPEELATKAIAQIDQITVG